VSHIRIAVAKWLSILLLGVFCAYVVVVHAPAPANLPQTWPEGDAITISQDGYFAFQVALPSNAKKVLIDFDHPLSPDFKRGDYAGILAKLDLFSDTLPGFALTPSAFGGQYVTSTFQDVEGVNSKLVRFSIRSDFQMDAKVVMTAVDVFGDVASQETAKVSLQVAPSPRNVLPDILLQIAFALSLGVFILYGSTFMAYKVRAYKNS
jgi:hypothetical protein